MVSNGRRESLTLLPVSSCPPPGADQHRQAGPGAAAAVLRPGRGGGEVGGAGARAGPAEPEPGQHGLQHAPVHQVKSRRTRSFIFPAREREAAARVRRR